MKSRYAASTAAKSLQSCPTLCDPIDGSPPGFPVPGILQKSRHRGHFFFFFFALQNLDHYLTGWLVSLSQMQLPDFGICFNKWFVDIRSYLIFSVRLHALEWTKDRVTSELSDFGTHFYW